MSDCWFDKENASKRPKCWKSKAKRGNAGTDKTEFLLTSVDNEEEILEINKEVEEVMAPEHGLALTFASTQELLTHKNIWIADSGATVHSTHCDEGMINVEEGGSDITAVNGGVVTAKKHGNLPRIMFNKHDNEVGWTVTLDASCSLTGKFNSCSLPQLM